MKRNRLLVILLMLFGVWLMSGCGLFDSDLETPKNVAISDGVVTWDAVEEAEKYKVIIDTEDHEATGTSFDLKTLDLEVGEYQVTVVAVKGDKISLPSDPIEYKVEVNEPTSLDAPQNVRIDGKTLLWNSVPNALSYLVKIGDTEYPVTSTSLDLTTIFLLVGTHSLTVKAVRNSLVSNPSTAVNYTVATDFDVDAVFGEILKLAHEDYEPDMDSEDFTSEDEYDDYLRISQLLSLYCEQAALVQMTEEQAKEVAEYIADFISGAEEVSSFAEFMNEYAVFQEIGILPEQIAYILLEFGFYGMELSIEENEEDILETEAQLLEAQNDIEVLIASSEYQELYNLLRGYANTENKALLDEFLTGPNVWYAVLQENANIAYSLIYNYSYQPDDDSYNAMFYQILKSAQEAGNTEFLEAIANSVNGAFWPFFELANLKIRVSNCESWIEKAEKELEVITDIKTAILSEKEIYRASFTSVTSYLFDLIDSITPTMIAAFDDFIDGNQLTIEEYFVLKDEIATVLLETLPEDQDFENHYVVVLYLMNAFSDQDISADLVHAETLGKQNRILIELFLKLAKKVDQETYEEVMAIVDGMVIPGEYYEDEYGYGDYGPDEYDYNKVIELILYVGTYLKDFEEENQSLLLELKALPLETAQIAYVKQSIGLYKAMIEQLSGSEYSEDVGYVLDQFVLDLPIIYDGLEIMGKIGKENFEIFLESEAAFLKKVLEFSEWLETGDSVDTAAEYVEILLDGYLPYNNTIMDNIDQEDVETLFRMMRIPFMTSAFNFRDNSFEDFSELFEDIVEPAAEAFYNGMRIQKQILTIAAAEDFQGLLDDDLDAMDAALGGFVVVLDKAFTEEYKNLLFDTITIVFDDIQKHPMLLDMDDKTEAEIDEEHDMIVDRLTEFFQNVGTAADFDYDNIENLTEAQLELLRNLFENLFDSTELPEE